MQTKWVLQTLCSGLASMRRAPGLAAAWFQGCQAQQVLGMQAWRGVVGVVPEAGGAVCCCAA